MPRPHRFLDSSASPQPTDLAARTFFADRQLEERMARVRQTIVEVRQRWLLPADRSRLAEQLLCWLEAQAETAAEAAAASAAVLPEQQQEQQKEQPQDEQQLVLEQELDAWSLILPRWRAILTADRNWADLREPSMSLRPGPQLQQSAEEQTAAEAADCAVLREYTDEKSYQLVFSRVLRALRSSDDSHVTPMVYLIELINIDLFNYTTSRLKPQCPTRAYRGLALSQAEWQCHRRLLELPVASRFIAVPLALTSTSKSPDVALQFVAKVSSAASAAGCVPCLQVIHVIGVPDSLMELYRRRFPQSVVSTICAVDIAGVSSHPDEQEVLLRGAFLQVLCLDQAPTSSSVLLDQAPTSSSVLLDQAPTSSSVLLDQAPTNNSVLLDQSPVQIPGDSRLASVQEVLVVNVNRDHLSNGHLGDQDGPARALFAAIVRVTRYRYCLDFCRQRDLTTDAAEYEAALRQAEQELQAQSLVE